MVAVPFLLASNVLVAVTVILVDAGAVESTVTLPLLSTVAYSLLTLHVTLLGAKFVVTTFADNCTDCPAATVELDGVTVTEVTPGVPGINSALFAKGDTENVFQT